MSLLDSEIVQILEKALQQKVARVTRYRNDYESSFELQNLDVTLDDKTVMEMVLKDVGPAAILPAARDSKQQQFFNPMRELQMYQSVLSAQHHGTARCYAQEVNSANAIYLLFLQRVAGLKLCFIGEFDIWLDAARWLAHFHREWETQIAEVSTGVSLIRYDRSYYRRWCDRAEDFVSRTAPVFTTAFTCISQRYDQVIDRLLAMPTTLCHGDFYPSNILVREEKSQSRLCPVDWELAAAGPGLIDLASLTAGRWSDGERQEFVRAYTNAAGFASAQKLAEDLNWCRLHLAVQWVGWSPQWAPPIDQANDWLTEMISLATALDLL